ncbi:hypothetical protein [Longibacter salinarum]|nr:hypothetical protein [Longibacter salinarum]
MIGRSLSNLSAKLFFVLSLFATLLVAGGCSSDEAPPLSSETEQAATLLPATSDMVAMMDVEHVRSYSPTAAARFNDMLADMRDSPKARAHLDAMNVDLSEDVQRIYVGGVLTDDRKNPILLVYGSFDPEAINDHVQSELQNDTTKVRSTEIGGRTAYVTDNDRGSYAAVVVNESLIMAGSYEQVQAGLARLDDDSEESLAASEEKLALLREAARGQSMWAALMSVPDDMKQSGSDKMDRIASVAEAGTMSLTFAENGNLDARVLVQAGDAETASNIADVMRGLLGLSKRRVNDEPDLQDVLQSVEIESRDAEVTMTGNVPASVIEQRFNRRSKMSSL